MNALIDFLAKGRTFQRLRILNPRMLHFSCQGLQKHVLEMCYLNSRVLSLFSPIDM